MEFPQNGSPLLRMYMAFEVLRSQEREFPAQLASIFLYIASHPGLRQEELMQATCMSSSSISRNVTWLGPRHRLGRPGLALVYRERDFDDPKRYRIFLTKKGKQLSHLVEQILIGIK